MKMDSMATRVCEANLVWEDSDNSDCATMDTYNLRQLSKVCYD